MRYPTCLVLVEEDASVGRLVVPADNVKATTQGTAAACSPRTVASGKSSSSSSSVLFALQHVQRALEDSATSAAPSHTTASAGFVANLLAV